MSGLIIEGRGLGFHRAGRDILTGVSLSVRRGESVALTGPSGSGKTALLALIAGLERPDSGTLTVAATATETGLILQGYGLIGLLTVEENVAMPLLAASRTPLPAAEVRTRALRALHTVGLTDLATKLVETLSGGQQQRVSIARALVTRPTLLLADEPSAALDTATRNHVLRALLELQHTGVTVVVATHDHAVAATLDRRVQMQDGRVATSSGPPEDR